MKIDLNPQIQDLISRGALFVANNSGGKDSQAMLLLLRAVVPANQLMVVHADLADVEWQGTKAHAEKISAGLPFIVTKAQKTFFDMVDHRQNWPSPQYRQCTSDLKRGPIEKAIRHYIKENGLSGLIVNCMGIRAQESTQRSKASAFKRNERNSKAGREWYDWLPIFNWTKDEVILEIKKAGQELHWAYQYVSRLSCVFCVMGNQADLKAAAEHNPELYARYVAKEKEVGKTLFMRGGKPTGLEAITGVKAA